MVDPFNGVFSGVSDPGERAVAVMPSNTADLPETPKSLYVGVGGDIAMIGDNEATGATPVVWRNVPAGACLPFRPRRIMATDTTAGAIVAIL